MQDLQKKLERLSSNKTHWRALPDSKKIEYINSCMQNLMQIKDTWVNLCVKAKGIPPQSHTVGQEWLVGPAVLMRAFRILKYSLMHAGKPEIKITQNRHTGQHIANVVPVNFYESLLFYKLKAEIVIQNGYLPTQGQKYQERKNTAGSLCAVMGAGNVASMPALDVIDKLFVHQSVCLLKFNPINAYLYDVFYTIFKHLIDDGFLD